MKNVSKILLTTILTVGIAATATAHDAKMHMKKPQKADCTVMDKMDKDKMMKKDPVLMAMMKKCMKQKMGKMKLQHKEMSEKHNHNEGAEEGQHH